MCTVLQQILPIYDLFFSTLFNAFPSNIISVFLILFKIQEYIPSSSEKEKNLLKVTTFYQWGQNSHHFGCRFDKCMYGPPYLCQYNINPNGPRRKIFQINLKLAFHISYYCVKTNNDTYDKQTSLFFPIQSDQIHQCPTT